MFSSLTSPPAGAGLCTRIRQKTGRPWVNSMPGRKERKSVGLSRILCLLIIIVVPVLSSPVATSRAEAPWITFDIQDGLLRRSVRILAPAHDGGMWAGTVGGLNRWDGARWQSYSAGHGLAGGAITAVVEHRGEVWAGSWGGGLSVLRGSNWYTFRTAESPLPGDWISALASDGDRLWVGTYGAGLALVRSGAWTPFTHTNSSLPSDWLTCLLPDGQGGIWVGTERAGLAHLDANGQWHRSTLPPDVAPGPHITALALLDEELWVGTSHGLVILNLVSQRWRSLGGEVNLPDEGVTALAAGTAGEMWIGTDDGLAHWYGEQLRTYTVHDGLPQNAIRTLALDAQGRLWVGTAGRGVAVRGEMSKPQVVRAPVILVHGWRGPDSDTLEDSEFWHLARWLREDGFTPIFATGISPENTLHANAARLRAVIDQVRRETGAPGVYLIGFSMGGLNSRAYLESTLYQGDVLRVFTLGSPHRGEHLWQTLLLWEYLAWRPDPSALELLPLHASLFNDTHGKAPAVPYTLVAGDTRAAELPTLFRELPAGDGLVSAWSALGVEGNGVDRRVSEDLHAWAKETILLGIPSLLYPRSTYDAHIRPYLFGVADAPGAGSPGAAAYRSLQLDPRTGLYVGDVAPGQTVTVSVPLDVAGRARMIARWKDTPLTVSLADPRGRLINEDAAGSDDRAEYVELGFADFASYVLTDTVPGDWALVLQNESKKAAAQYVAYATFPSPVRLTLGTNEAWYNPGDEVVISAEIVAPAGSVAVDRVEAELYDPARQRELVTLQPVHGKGRGSSLLFEGRYRAPAGAGYYVILARAVGRRGNLPLERGEQAVFGVRGDGASLAGAYSLRPEPAGENKWLGLETTVGVQVAREGEYLCSVTLLDGAGERVVTLAHTARLEPGEQTMTIEIPGSTVSASGRDGPYRLGEVILLDVLGAGVLVDRAMGDSQVISLRAADFSP
jgi:hypothetical protein